MTLDEFKSLLDEALAFYNSEHSGAQIDEGVTGGLGAIRYDVVQALAEAQKERARKNLGLDEIPAGGGGSGPGTFIAVYGQTTSAEIEAAYLAGQTVAVLYENRLGYLIQRTSATDHTFAITAPFASESSGIPIYVLTCYADAWGFFVLDAENVQNKVSTITEAADNTQYPSARAVINYVKEHGGGGGEGGGNFEAVFDVTTAAEIEAAYQAGKTITMNNNGVIYYLRERTSGTRFEFTTPPYLIEMFSAIYIYTAVVENFSWSMSSTKAETQSNKVTSISAASTNTQYPSAKAVFDYVKNSAGGGGSGADLLNENGVIKQEHLPEGYPYSEMGIGTILPETGYFIDEETGMGFVAAPIILTLGEKYTVNWNGIDYVCTALDASFMEENAAALGNIGALTGGEDTGEPFILLASIGASDDQIIDTFIVVALDGTATGTVSITGLTEIFTPISPKYMPVSASVLNIYARMQQQATGDPHRDAFICVTDTPFNTVLDAAMNGVHVILHVEIFTKKYAIPLVEVNLADTQLTFAYSYVRGVESFLYYLSAAPRSAAFIDATAVWPHHNDYIVLSLYSFDIYSNKEPQPNEQ